LKGVLRALAPEPADEDAVHLVAMLQVQRLEGWNPHGLHHRV
jgi:hypothetical protein